jgi:hypothetical protein
MKTKKLTTLVQLLRGLRLFTILFNSFLNKIFVDDERFHHSPINLALDYQLIDKELIVRVELHLLEEVKGNVSASRLLPQSRAIYIT